MNVEYPLRLLQDNFYTLTKFQKTMKLGISIVLVALTSMFVGINSVSAVEAFGHADLSVTSEITSATAVWVPVDGAAQYHVYYRESGNTSWPHSVIVGSNTTSVTINHLNASTSYYYKVAALVEGREVWQTEKLLASAKSPEPVLGIFDDLFGNKPMYDTGFDDMPETIFETVDDEESYNEMNGIGGSDMDSDEIYDTQYENEFIEETDIVPVTDDQSMNYDNYGDEFTGETDDTEIDLVNELTTEVFTRNDWGTAYWSSPDQTVSKYHIYYWSADTDRHAVRDLSPDAQNMTINALHTDRAYFYQVEAILTNGQSVWVTEVLPLN